MEQVPIPTTLLVHCDVIKEDDIQEISVPPATSTSEVIRLVLERYGLEKRWESHCLAYIKGLKRNRSFRSSNTKPRVLLSTDCPLLLSFHQGTGRFVSCALCSPAPSHWPRLCLYVVGNVPEHVKMPILGKAPASSAQAAASEPQANKFGIPPGVWRA